MRRASTISTFQRFLVDHSIEGFRIERLNAERNRIVVDHRGRRLAVSYQGERPSRFALAKLSYAVQEVRA